MNVTARSYLTAGVAVLGAGAVALTPVQPIPNNLALAQDKAVANLAVNLASSIDPITPWVDTIKLSAENIGKLASFYLEKPFPLLQTIGANIGTYLGELPDFSLIFSQMAGNIQTFFQAPWSPGTCATDPCGDPAFYNGDFISNVPITNKVPFLGELSQRQLYTLLPLVLQEDPELLTTLAPLLAFAGNHYSGQVAGLVGPLLAPVIQLTRSFTAIGDYFKAGDVIGAINELINIPANVTNAVLNGAGYFDLTGVVNAIVPLPDTIKSIGLNLGGLISPPVPFEGTLADPTAFNGGTLFDNIAVEAGLGGINVKSPGLPVSWFGSVIGLGQFLSEAMLVTPGSGAAVAPTASVRAAAAAADPAPTPAPEPLKGSADDDSAAGSDNAVKGVDSGVGSDNAIRDDDSAVGSDNSISDVDIKKATESAPPAVSTPAPRKRSAVSDNNDNDGGSRGSHKGARGKHAA